MIFIRAKGVLKYLCQGRYEAFILSESHIQKVETSVVLALTVCLGFDSVLVTVLKMSPGSAPPERRINTDRQGMGISLVIKHKTA